MFIYGYLFVQVQIGELSIADARHRLTVHCEVDLTAVALDGHIVPVLVIQEVPSCQRGPTIYPVHRAASWNRIE